MGKRGSGKVLLASCYSDRTIHTGYHESAVIAGINHGRTTIIDYHGLISSPRVAEARNILVEKFLAHPARPEWLMMVDADMIFHRDDVLRLLAAGNDGERPIVSGLYFGGRVDGPQKPYVWVWNQDELGNPEAGVVQGIGGENVWPDDAVVKVDAVGAGMLFMHRDALTAIGDKYRDTGQPWFAETAAGGHGWGEDITFCVRAKTCGVPIFLHCGVKCGHEKSGILDTYSYQRYLDDTRSDEELEQEWFQRRRTSGEANFKGARTAPALKVVTGP
jgi:hypothetical protein